MALSVYEWMNDDETDRKLIIFTLTFVAQNWTLV